MKRSVSLIGAVLVAVACNNDITGLGPPSDPTKETFAASLAVNISQMTKTPEGVFYRDLVMGSGAVVTDSAVSVNVTYAGFLKDGKLFDSKSNVLITLGGVVPGFRIGLLGMKEGGKRKVVIPSALGYGRFSQRLNPSSLEITIPRQSTLIFDLEVVKVTNPAKPAT